MINKLIIAEANRMYEAGEMDAPGYTALCKIEMKCMQDVDDLFILAQKEGKTLEIIDYTIDLGDGDYCEKDTIGRENIVIR